jgi:hypothetical protein
MKRKTLSRRQQAFVNEYIRCWNASEAARRTGSKGKAAWQQAWRMSRNVEVQAAISERIQQAALAANEVLARLAAQARGDLPTSVHDTPRGEVTEYDTLGALIQIGRHLRLFSAKADVGVAVNIEGLDAMLEKVYGTNGIASSSNETGSPE